MKTLSILLAVLGMALTPLAEAGVSALQAKNPPAGGQSVVPSGGGFLYVHPAAFAKGLRRRSPGGHRALHGDISGAYRCGLVGAKVTVAAKKPGFAVIPSEDRQIHPELERFMASRAKSETLELPGSHVIFLLHSKEVAALIEKAAQTAK